MSLKNFNVQNGLSVNDIQVVDGNSNVIANALISNTFISTNNSNITLNPNGTGVIDVSNKTISNVASPNFGSDAATKGYVDATAQGLSIKDSVQAATIGANILLDGSVTLLDDVTLVAGYRVLVKDQNTQSQNGIYLVSSSGAWTRSPDMNSASEFYGAFTFVEAGTRNASTGWVTTNNPTSPVTVGTTAITFTQFSGAGSTATTINAGIGDVKIGGGTPNYVLAASDTQGNLQYANIANYFLVTSNISTVVAGSTLAFTVDYANASYPGGIYTLKQLGPVSMTMTDQWSQAGSNIGTNKNSYANYVAGTTNIANVIVTLTLANASFSVQSTDSLTIGGTTLTGTQLLAISNINNISPVNGTTTATFTIPSTSLSTSVEYNGLSTVTNSVSANLTNSRGSTGIGVTQVNGTTLTSTAPIAYSVNSISGNFPSSSIPYWNLNQSFNWSVSTTGTTSTGNLTYSGGAISTTSLSSVGGTSGTSSSIDSTSSYTITTNDYYGLGLNGYGNRTIPSVVNGTVNSATKYYPLFWKTTTNSSLPSFTVSDSHNSNNYVTGQGATANTTPSNYLWMAIPNSGNASPLASHTFKHVFGGFDIVDTPTVTGTQIISSSGQGYNYSIYGFSGFSQASLIITTS